MKNVFKWLFVGLATLMLSIPTMVQAKPKDNDFPKNIVEEKKVETITFNETVGVSMSLVTYESISGEVMITNLHTTETFVLTEAAEYGAFGGCIGGREYYLCWKAVWYYPYMDWVICSKPCGGEQ